MKKKVLYALLCGITLQSVNITALPFFGSSKPGESSFATFMKQFSPFFSELSTAFTKGNFRAMPGIVSRYKAQATGTFAVILSLIAVMVTVYVKSQSNAKNQPQETTFIPPALDLLSKPSPLAKYVPINLEALLNEFDNDATFVNNFAIPILENNKAQIQTLREEFMNNKIQHAPKLLNNLLKLTKKDSLGYLFLNMVITFMKTEPKESATKQDFENFRAAERAFNDVWLPAKK